MDNMMIKANLVMKSYLTNIICNDDLYYCDFEMRDGQIVHLSIALLNGFPGTLPKVNFDKKYYIPEIPHVSPDGNICYVEKENVSFTTNINDLLDEVFKRVEETLLERNTQLDYHKEFYSYLATLEESEIAYSFLDETKKGVFLIKTKKIGSMTFCVEDIKIGKEDEKLSRILDSKMSQLAFSINHKQRRGRRVSIIKIHSSNGLYIRFNKRYDGTIPNNSYMWTEKEISAIVLEHFDDIDELQSYAKNKKEYFYVLSFCNLNGDNVLMGLKYTKKSKFSLKTVPLIDTTNCEKYTIKPYILYNSTYKYITSRSGMQPSDKRLLIVGCGSVGSELVYLLSKSGFRYITLLDDDKMSAENTYRHFLGYQQRVSKVVQLKSDIENRYPNTELTIHELKIQDAIEEMILDLNEFDIVISVTGDSNIDRWLNKEILSNDAVGIYGWLEAYGVGGHAMVTNINKGGCFNCLFEDEVHNSSSLIMKSDLPFTKNIGGCMGTYTKYGALDATETAMLIARIVLGYTNGEIDGNALYSWKGNSAELIKEGFEVSANWTSDFFGYKNPKKECINPECKVCKGL